MKRATITLSKEQIRTLLGLPDGQSVDHVQYNIRNDSIIFCLVGDSLPDAATVSSEFQLANSMDLEAYVEVFKVPRLVLKS